ncbi:hypothetical protein BB561_005677 [Smittium simulii]|uniref:Ketosynthase family 3 (KS3) domain-containing protein n=1 Tax=Smittium simulii TaxID=133385 RepID=A0A2T9Y955_9FUNG|nr:hypothetical protein BB561_005677 [Smittium simulii]
MNSLKIEDSQLNLVETRKVSNEYLTADYSEVRLYRGLCKAYIRCSDYNRMSDLINNFAVSKNVDLISIDTPDFSTEVEIFFNFLDFLLAKIKSSETKNFATILETLVNQLTTDYLNNEDIHIAIQVLPSIEIKKFAINTFYRSRIAINSKSYNIADFDDNLNNSALFKAVKEKKASLVGIFGGQGIKKDYFDEIIDLYDIYKPLISDYVKAMSNNLTELYSTFEKDIFLPQGFNIIDWIENPSQRPDNKYLIQAPFSSPLLCLLQLMQLYVLFKTMRITPAAFISNFSAFTGHSQGLVTAIALSSSDSEESFISNSKLAIHILLVIGVKSQITFPIESINPDIVKDAILNFEDIPSPMLHVTGLKKIELEKIIQKTNKLLPKDNQVHISINNGYANMIVSGPANSLYSLSKSLRALKEGGDTDQTRIPFSMRKKNITNEFLPVTLPYHSVYLEETADKILNYLEMNNLKFDSNNLLAKVQSNNFNINLQEIIDLNKEIVYSICKIPMNWGTGVRMIYASLIENSIIKDIGIKADLFKVESESVKYAVDWAKEFGPQLVRSKYDYNKIIIDTKMSRLLGKPPVMVAGMTPSTVSPEFVSAVLNAGYHVELAGGGYYDKSTLRAAIDKINNSVDPGNNISLNVVYLNVKMASTQIPLIQILRKENKPVDGLTISAGVPSIEACTEIIKGLKDVGIKHISFKPGSSAAIRQVTRIAGQNPDMPIMLQWTGGRGGGHHSFEDLHQPILETYSEIRNQKNIILVLGSGIGGAEDSVPYITGEWSLFYEKSRMPFDGILLGSRMMVAKECTTSDEAKELIVSTPGTSDKNWEKSYKGPIGGVVTVISELEQPIHMIATRGVMLWKEFDEKIFSLPTQKLEDYLVKNRDYIIKRLNSDFQKVWFGKSKDGKPVDLTEMTYSEVVYRLIELMYIKPKNKWIDVTLRNMLGDFLRRIDERFSKNEHGMLLQSYDQIENPYAVSKRILDTYPESYEQVIIIEDKDYFLELCAMPERKPAPFVPILDKNFKIWFKRDSLWQSENISAVVDQDVGRVCILQGPVAAQYSTEANEPAKKILDDITSGLIDKIVEKFYNGDKSKIPVVEYLDQFVSTKPSSYKKQFLYTTSDNTCVFKTNNSTPLISLDDWIETIAGDKTTWLKAFLTVSYIVSDGKIISNNIKPVFKQRENQTITLKYSNDGLPIGFFIKTNKQYDDIEVHYDSKTKIIKYIMNFNKVGTIVPIELYYRYQPSTPYALIHEVTIDRNLRVFEFYKKLWISNPSTLKQVKINGLEYVAQDGIRVSKEEVARFCQVIGNSNPKYVQLEKKGPLVIPMDYIIKIAWDAMMDNSMGIIYGNMLEIVHFSNKVESLVENNMLTTDDEFYVTSRIKSQINQYNGKFVTVEAYIIKEDVKYYRLITSYVFRGHYSDVENTFEEVDEPQMCIHLKSQSEIAALQSKEWFILEDTNCKLKINDELVFSLQSHYKFGQKKTYNSVKTSGNVLILSSNRSYKEIAKVDYTSGPSFGNPVIDYLKRCGSKHKEPNNFENMSYSMISNDDAHLATVQTHKSNMDYSIVSTDFNPIHTNPYFADFCGLPGMILHGMWTSANARKVIEVFAADNKPENIVFYDVTFLGMVLPGETLETKLYHEGMLEGKKIIRVESYKTSTGTKILEGIAHVAPPKTVYVFTGQGSQAQNMGMDLYKRSSMAAKVYNRANDHMYKKYGFSLLEILQNNPKEVTVSFGGKNGTQIRKNYMELTYESINKAGKAEILPLFPEITDFTTKYKFISPAGLINSTEFTQQLILLYEIVAFQDMVDHQLIPKNIMFAGHSLGEFCANYALAGVMGVEEMVELIFFRGLAMQYIVERDENGKSAYGMVAFNPLRVSPNFINEMYCTLIESISKICGGLIETVNYNVDNWQYVIAGESKLLSVFAKITDYFSLNKDIYLNFCNSIKDSDNPKIALEQSLNKIILEVLVTVEAEIKANNGFCELDRSNCTIPLPGIDVPFHSSYLMTGVSFIRQVSYKYFTLDSFDIEYFEGRYIPNIIGKPLELSKNYLKQVYDATQSPIIKEELENWDNDNTIDLQKRKKLGYKFMIEMIVYQFASAVQWIKTQDVLFEEFKFERLIEIGPSPILKGMAERTQKLKYKEFDNANLLNREFLCYSTNYDEIYYKKPQDLLAVSSIIASSQTQNAVKINPDSVSSVKIKKLEQKNTVAVEKEPVIVEPTEVSSNQSAAPESNSSAGELEDVNIPTSLIITSIISQKTRIKYSDISTSKSLKEIVNGKSALQNEIVGDLNKDLPGLLPERTEEIPLGELFDSIESNVNKLGPYSAVKVSRLIVSKMPVGMIMSKVLSILNNKYGLGPLRSDALLLVGTTMETDARIESESAVSQWLESVAQEYSKIVGISYKFSSGSGTNSNNGSSSTVVVNSEEFEKTQKEFKDMLNSQLNAISDYLGVEVAKEHDHKFETVLKESAKIQDSLDLWVKEHGEAYSDGIKPKFRVNRIRYFDSYWNWAQHLAEEIFYNILHGEYIKNERKFEDDILKLKNKASKRLIESLEYKEKLILEKRIYYLSQNKIAYDYIQNTFSKVILECKAGLNVNPKYLGINEFNGPFTTITNKGKIEYSEVSRNGIETKKDYISFIMNGISVPENSNLHKLGITTNQKSTPVPKDKIYKNSFEKCVDDVRSMVVPNRLPYMFMKNRIGSYNNYSYDPELTIQFVAALLDISENGLNLTGKTVLITGCGRNSIGLEILKGILMSGAKVIATTSSMSYNTAKMYEAIYKEYGSKSCTLRVVPFNQGSQTDINSLMDYIYDSPKNGGLESDIDVFIPFGAFSSYDREIADFDSEAELSHRIMLTNLIRMIGRIKFKKESAKIKYNPAQVLLPLSLNHGGFGGDGTYPESKIGLMTLFDRWYSENWDEYININGAVVGWSRGTSLMENHNNTAYELEKTGAITFQTRETAYGVLGLLHPVISQMSNFDPVYVDISGGFEFITDFSDLVTSAREALIEKSKIQKTIVSETSFDFNCVEGDNVERLYKTDKIYPKTLFKLPYPELLPYSELADKKYMYNMINLDTTIVITGFGEISSHGNATTRWELETEGKLSIQGCILLGWLMGLIEYFSGKLKDGSIYHGWIDSETKAPIEDRKIKVLYEKKILKDSGIRVIDPSINLGYTPDAKTFIREVLIEKDMRPIVTSKDEADNFILQNGNKVKVWKNNDESYSVQFLKGSSIFVPKASVFDGLISGQIPTGFDPERYGIPKDIHTRVDRLTLYTLIAVSEALMRAGIEDPYELYKFVHVSEVGISLGSSVGGAYSAQKIIRDRYLDIDVHNDVLQESFVSSMAGWVNLLLISSCGPIAIPSGACATAAVSIDVAVQNIISGKAKIMFAGGQDDFCEESSYEFYNMKATINGRKEIDDGRDPREMSRPFSSTRSGFMDSVEIGLPIFGVIAYSGTASDKAGRSFPAPGKGLISSAKQNNTGIMDPLFNIEFRKRQLENKRKTIRDWVEDELDLLKENTKALDVNIIKDVINSGRSYSAEGRDIIDRESKKNTFIESQIEFIIQEFNRQNAEALDYWSKDFWMSNPHISPLKGALSTYGLTIDDIDFCSCHGTSTRANDRNEGQILTSQFTHLKRTKGNVLPIVCQKGLTGHAKGGAASLAINGLLQSFITKIIPGNLSADNISEEFKEMDYFFNPSKSLKKEYIKAALLKSLGFGQIGAEILVVNADYLFAAIPKKTYEDYTLKVKKRYIKAEKYLYETLTGLRKQVLIKDSAPYTADLEEKVILNPSSRVEYDRISNTYKFNKTNQVPKKKLDTKSLDIIKSSLESSIKSKENVNDNQGVGVDIELITNINIENETFLERNFTVNEIEYCRNRPDPHSSFAGKWCAKESVIKAISSYNSKKSKDNLWKYGSAAPLKLIEIQATSVENGGNGVPIVLLHGEINEISKNIGIKTINVSISHTDGYAVSVANAS